MALTEQLNETKVGTGSSLSTRMALEDLSGSQLIDAAILHRKRWAHAECDQKPEVVQHHQRHLGAISRAFDIVTKGKDNPIGSYYRVEGRIVWKVE